MYEDTGGWSQPSPVYVNGEYQTDGWVWMGKHEVTDENFEALQAFCKKHGMPVPASLDDCDHRALCGLYGREWSSHWYDHTSSDNKPGGEGSEAYENQHLGEGVFMSKDAMWHYTKEGELVKDRPANYAYHWVDMGGGYRDAHEGPEPNSDADLLLGDSKYRWARGRALYVIV